MTLVGEGLTIGRSAFRPRPWPPTRRQLQCPTIEHYLVSFIVDAKPTPTEGVLGVMIDGDDAVGDRLHAKNDLAGREGFGDVIVSSGLKSDNTVIDLASRCQHKDPQPTESTSLSQHLKSVNVGQSQVEDHDVQMSIGQQLNCFGSRAGGQDIEFRALQIST